MKRNTDNILMHYLVCALWVSDMDSKSISDIIPSSMDKAKEDVESFLLKAGNLLSSDWSDEQIGHDFWLTRNGHGAGFWDRDLGEVGEQLTKASDQYPAIDLYVGDDGLVHA